MRLVELLRAINIAITPVTQLLAVVQVLPEMDAIYTPIYKRSGLEATRVSDVARYYGPATAALLQRYAADQHAYCQRCKRAVIT